MSWASDGGVVADDGPRADQPPHEIDVLTDPQSGLEARSRGVGPDRRGRRSAARRPAAPGRTQPTRPRSRDDAAASYRSNQRGRADRETPRTSGPTRATAGRRSAQPVRAAHRRPPRRRSRRRRRTAWRRPRVRRCGHRRVRGCRASATSWRRAGPRLRRRRRGSRDASSTTRQRSGASAARQRSSCSARSRTGTTTVSLGGRTSRPCGSGSARLPSTRARGDPAEARSSRRPGHRRRTRAPAETAGAPAAESHRPAAPRCRDGCRDGAGPEPVGQPPPGVITSEPAVGVDDAAVHDCALGRAAERDRRCDLLGFEQPAEPLVGRAPPRPEAVQVGGGREHGRPVEPGDDRRRGRRPCRPGRRRALSPSRPRRAWPRCRRPGRTARVPPPTPPPRTGTRRVRSGQHGRHRSRGRVPDPTGVDVQKLVELGWVVSQSGRPPAMTAAAATAASSRPNRTGCSTAALSASGRGRRTRPQAPGRGTPAPASAADPVDHRVADSGWHVPPLQTSSATTAYPSRTAGPRSRPRCRPPHR